LGRKTNEIEVSLAYLQAPTIMAHWLITGGCGFIGGNLLVALTHEGKTRMIRILDNLSVGTQDDLEFYISQLGSFSKKDTAQGAVYRLDTGGTPQIELYIGDIRDEEAAIKATEGIDVVMHLAANTGVQPSIRNPRLDMESNVVGVFNLLEASRHQGVRRFILASSGAAVGETDPPITEEKVARPVSPYGASKLAGEGYCSAYSRSFGLQAIVLRFGNVYGPLSKRKNSVVAKYIKDAINGLPLEVYGDGRQTRDFIFIEDLVAAILLAARSSAAGEVFQIATCTETSVLEIAMELKRLFKNETGLDVDVIHGGALSGEVRRIYADISKAQKVLGFEPRYNLSEGLQKTLEYFLRQGSPTEKRRARREQ